MLEGWRGSTVDVDLRFEPDVDEMLRELYTLRGRLVGEIRLSDGAATVRSEALLAEPRASSAEPEL